MKHTISVLFHILYAGGRRCTITKQYNQDHRGFSPSSTNRGQRVYSSLEMNIITSYMGSPEIFVKFSLFRKTHTHAYHC